jgi:transposase
MCFRAMAKPLVTDELWKAVVPLLPPEQPKPKGGRPRVSDRAALTGILFVLRTGISWEDVPAEMGLCGMTCWRRLRGWQTAGIWSPLHRVLLERLPDADRLDWRRAALDSTATSGRRRRHKVVPVQPVVLLRNQVAVK